MTFQHFGLQDTFARRWFSLCWMSVWTEALPRRRGHRWPETGGNHRGLVGQEKTIGPDTGHSIARYIVYIYMTYCLCIHMCLYIYICVWTNICILIYDIVQLMCVKSVLGSMSVSQSKVTWAKHPVRIAGKSGCMTLLAHCAIDQSLKMRMEFPKLQFTFRFVSMM